MVDKLAFGSIINTLKQQLDGANKMAQYNFNVADQLAKPFMDYAQTIPNADRIRLAGFLLGLVNAVQQTATITQDDLFHAKETTNLFDDVDRNDPMDPGYHLHNLLETLADEFDELANAMDENGEDAAAAELEAIRVAALSKLTDTEKAALGIK